VVLQARYRQQGFARRVIVVAETTVGSAPGVDVSLMWSRDLPVVRSLPADALGAQGSESPMAAMSRLVSEIGSLSERIRDVDRDVKEARRRGDSEKLRELHDTREGLTRRRRALREEQQRLTGH
jgi:hypothetical protein